MRKEIYIIFLICTIFLISCSNNQEQEKQRQLQVQEKNKQDSILNVAFEMAMRKATEDSMMAAQEKQKK